MTQQYIDFGSFPDDPTADSIRESFQKVQENFTDLYTNALKQGVLELVPGFGLRSEDDRITGNLVVYANIPNVTMKTAAVSNTGANITNLIVKPETSPSWTTTAIVSDATPIQINLAPNITTSNANFTGTTTTANLKVTGLVKTNLIPEGDEVLDLGSPTNRWKDLYLSGNTLTIGTQSISSSTEGFEVSAGLITSNISVGTVEADYVAGTITTNAQPNITSLGILQGLAVSGDILSGNMSMIGNLDTVAVNAHSMNVSGVFTAGTISGNIVLPPGATIDAPGGASANMAVMFNDSGKAAAVPGLAYNKAQSLLTIQGNVEGGNINTSGAITVSRTATVGNLATGGNVFANSGNVAGGNIISLGILSATSTVTGGNLSTGGYLTVTGNAAIGNITAVNSITGNLVSITGNISGANLVASGILKVDGNANVGNLTTSGEVSAATLKATAANINGNATVSGNISTTSGNIVTTNGKLSGASLFSTGLADITGDLIGRSNVTANGILTVLGNSVLGNVTSGGALSVTGNATIGNVSTTGLSVTGNVTGGNLNIAGILRAGDSNLANVNATGSMTVTGTHTAGNLSTGGALAVTGNANIGNVGTSGFITANGNITGANIKTLNATIFANGSFSGAGVDVGTGNLVGGNISVVANLMSGNIFANSGSIQANLLTGNSISIAANVTSGNLYANSGMIKADVVTGNSATVTGNVTGGNLKTTGTANIGALIVTTGANITGTANIAGTVIGSLFQGNGANLTNIVAANIVGQVANAASADSAAQATVVTQASQPNITSLGTLTGLTLNGAGSISGASSISGGNVSVNSYVIHSTDIGISALGSSQAGAYALSKEVNVITTATAASAEGVRLPIPPSSGSLQITIINASASAIKVYPTTGAQIDRNGTNTGVTVGVDGKLYLFSTSTTQWYALTTIYA